MTRFLNKISGRSVKTSRPIRNKKSIRDNRDFSSQFNSLGLPVSSTKQRTIVGKKKILPNNPCWCGSGKKYKKCHGSQERKSDFSVMLVKSFFFFPVYAAKKIAHSLLFVILFVALMIALAFKDKDEQDATSPA